MTYSDTFTASVPLEKGFFTPALKGWFVANGVPIVEEGFPVIGEGLGWDAWVSQRPVEGLNSVRFRFKDKGIAMLFKLTWHDFQ